MDHIQATVNYLKTGRTATIKKKVKLQTPQVEDVVKEKREPTDTIEVIKVSELSEESQAVLAEFGPEAPRLLNDYCCSVEDALIEQVARADEMKQAFQRASQYVSDDDLVKLQAEVENKARINRKLKEISAAVDKKVAKEARYKADEAAD